MFEIYKYKEFIIERCNNKTNNFYNTIGMYLSNRKVVKELGMPVWDDNEKEWLIVFDGLECIGFTSFVEKSEKAYLKSSWVHPNYRGNGIFDYLFSIRLSILKGKVVEGTATEKSKNTYLRYGFELIRMRGKYYVFRKDN